PHARGDDESHSAAPDRGTPYASSISRITSRVTPVPTWPSPIVRRRSTMASVSFSSTLLPSRIGHPLTSRTLFSLNTWLRTPQGGVRTSAPWATHLAASRLHPSIPG